MMLFPTKLGEACIDDDAVPPGVGVNRLLFKRGGGAAAAFVAVVVEPVIVDEFPVR